VSCAGYFSAQASAAVLRGFIGCPGHERDGPANRRRQFAAAQLAVELGVTSRQVAIAYVLSMDFPTYPILQPLTPAYIREALGALALRLTPAQRARLEGNVEAGKYETTPELVDMATHVL
jgi:aryl-alcohol dehydrogenase-like predicted oxidoreductase